MSAIYQKARPIRWEQVVGQEHVKDVLRSALEQGRVGHAYLFSGPRGVGKTTTARLIAMTANCTGTGPKPCGECESCLAVRAGNHPDVMEIDAASNNSVEDVRDLREKVGLAAMRGGKKIYILDEAHMMSKSAFNALLKTLEEPPSHVIFILATTEPEKIIPTILSRCQHYRFRRLTPEEIAGKLADLAGKEGVSAEPAALQLIGKLADGAMRDGESLLERMLAAGNSITLEAVETALGLPPGEQVRHIAQALVQDDPAAAIQGATQLYRAGFAARTLVEGLVSTLGDALHAELGLSGQRIDGADVGRLLRLQAALDEQESRFARSADQLSLELALTHALLAADGPQAPSSAPRRAADIPADVTQRLGRLERELADLRARAGSTPSTQVRGDIPDFDPTARSAPAPRASAPVPPPSAQAAPSGGTWEQVVGLTSLQLRAFLKPARRHAESGYVSLSYDARGSFHAKQLLNKYDEVAALVAQVFGPVVFEVITAEGSARKTRVGGGGGVAEAPAPLSPSAPVARPAPAPAEVAPVKAAPAPVPDDIPDFETRSRAPRAAPLRPAAPPSPDDRAPAPLPERESAPWEETEVAKVPPQQVAEAAEAAPRELYLGEPISEEPQWEDIGGPAPLVPEAVPLPSVYDEFVPQRPTPQPAPAVVASPAPIAPAARPPTGDIRAHPLYEEVKERFSGRVREIGKNRRHKKATEESAEADPDEGDAAEA